LFSGVVSQAAQPRRVACLMRVVLMMHRSESQIANQVIAQPSIPFKACRAVVSGMERDEARDGPLQTRCATV
jgi:hypothetical protein